MQEADRNSKKSSLFPQILLIMLIKRIKIKKELKRRLNNLSKFNNKANIYSINNNT
jgi:hypothetical protein